MFKRTFAVVSLAALLLAPASAFAHERQGFTIGGTQYLFVVGSLNEPTVVDDKTGVDLRIIKADSTDPTNSKAAAAVPVTGLESTLKVELSAGGKKKTLDLSPAYGDAGAYKAQYYPTVQTTYAYRVFGQLNGTEVSLSFTCNPAGHVASPEDKTAVEIAPGVTRTFKAGQFGCPLAKAELGFPEESTTLVDLDAHVDEHMMGMMADGAKEKTRTTAAVVLGFAGIALAVVALRKSRTPKV